MGEQEDVERKGCLDAVTTGTSLLTNQSELNILLLECDTFFTR